MRLQLWNELKDLPSNVESVVTDCKPFSTAVAKILMDKTNIFLLGNEIGHAVALEGSLKLKELTYKHCQAYNFLDCANGLYSFVT